MRWLALLVLTAAAWGDFDKDTKLEPADRVLERPLRVLKDGITIDLGKAVFRGPEATPDRYEGIGLIVEGRKKVTIRGGAFHRFKCAILVKDCENVILDGIDVSGNFRQRLKSTPEREDGTDWLWPHENDEQQWRKNYGAGICLENCRDCVVVRCVGSHQQNGLILDRCAGVEVLRNDFSFNSGWGIAMWRSSGNRVLENFCDWCVRGYSHGVYDRGQDSAGILVFEQCHENYFLLNSATHGGDGFFLYAGNETLKKTGAGGCNGNIVFKNDFSHAVANGIEATFSTANRFADNRCEDCNYGIWAGYSYGSYFLGNRCRRNSIAGIAIEHGMDNQILANRIEENPKGIWLWWDEDKDLLASKFGQVHPCRSEGYLLVENRFSANEKDVVLRDTSRVAFGGEVPADLVKQGRCDEISSGAKVPLKTHLLWPQFEGMGPLWSPREWPKDLPRGRKYILIGEWGPLDPRKTDVYPRRVVAWDACAFHVLGSDEYAVEGLPEGLLVERAERTFRVRGGEDGLRPFQCAVTTGGKRFPVSGVLLNATWKVRFWKWTNDPREHKDTFEGEPVETLTTRRLDFQWRHGGPAGGDRFATRAETSMWLPAGAYEVRTVSDDGVRVTIDGKVVQEDWTWHAPRENRSTFAVDAGVHAIVLEHFEIDGYAALVFDLRPAR